MLLNYPRVALEIQHLIDFLSVTRKLAAGEVQTDEELAKALGLDSVMMQLGQRWQVELRQKTFANVRMI